MFDTRILSDNIKSISQMSHDFPEHDHSYDLIWYDITLTRDVLPEMRIWSISLI